MHRLARTHRPASVGVSVVFLAAALVLLIGRTDSAPPLGSCRPVPKETIEQGAQVYFAQCARCHGDGEGVGGVAEAPTHGAGGHTWFHPKADLERLILDGIPPRAPEPVVTMPPWRRDLSPSDLAAVLAYLETWWSPQQRRARLEWFGCEP